jgi:hypothetical protein
MQKNPSRSVEAIGRAKQIALRPPSSAHGLQRSGPDRRRGRQVTRVFGCRLHQVGDGAFELEILAAHQAVGIEVEFHVGIHAAAFDDPVLALRIPAAEFRLGHAAAVA